MEKLLFGDLFGLGMMADEDDLDVVVFRAQEADHPEVETSGDVLLKLAHRSANIHHCYDHRVGLVFDGWFPDLEAEVFRFNTLEFGITLGGVALHIFHDGALFVQVGHWPLLAYIGKAHRLGLQFLLTFLFKVRKPQIFKDHGGQFLHGDFRLVVVLTGLFACITFLASARPGFLGYNIANFTLTVPLSSMFLLAGVEAETVFIEGANGNTYPLGAIRQDNALFTDDFT